jgi:PAS domain S-box-containing protein
MNEERFSKLFRSNPLALTLTSVKDNRYIDVNTGFERITGWGRDEIIGRTPFEIGLWIEPRQRADMMRKLASGTPVHNLEFTVRTRSGELRVGLGSAELVEIDGEPCVLSAATDITERARDVARLREREEHFRIVANSVPVVIWMTGSDTHCTYVNQVWLDFTGRSLEMELGYGWTESLHPDDAQQCLDRYAHAFERREFVQVEYRLRRRDGEYRWFLACGVPRFEPDGTFSGYIGSAMDISGRKELEQTLSALSQRLIDAHDVERVRLARVLDDDINQRLATLTPSLGMLLRSLPPWEFGLRQTVEAATHEVQNLMRDVHGLSAGLHSPTLDVLGLGTAAAGLCRQIADRYGVVIGCRAETIPSLSSPAVSRCLFRVLEDVLQAAVDAGSVTSIDVSLLGSADEVALTIQVRGRGFDPNQISGVQGLGITSLQERLKLVGGALSVDATSRTGTTLRASVPVQAE